MISRKPWSLFSLLIWLTFFFLAAQLSFFFIHDHLSSLIDTLTKSAIFNGKFSIQIWLPIAIFIAWQLLAYFLLITFIWFITQAISESLQITKKILVYGLGISLWALCAILILLLNSQWYPHSFFAPPFIQTLSLIKPISMLILAAYLVANIHCFVKKKHRLLASFFLGIISINLWMSLPITADSPNHDTIAITSPNIILIGLDSLRPDFTQSPQTKNIDQFLMHSANFTHAYTPLARTFPSWISILTAKYPKHHRIRMNLADRNLLSDQSTLAKHLQKLGYETIYATDEKRFSNILNADGFDHIIGPKMGVNDFLLGSLTDFPFTNLLVALPCSHLLFPYNYANRAAAVTYDPKHFLNLVRRALTQARQSWSKPLFLAIHLCVSHWPYFKAGDPINSQMSYKQQYQAGVAAVDWQLGELLKLLKQQQLLDHSLVVLLSDHGTTLGLPDDRLISDEKYLGDRKELSSIPRYKRSDTHTYSLNTSYGQATDVLSLKQYHSLFALQGFGISIKEQQIQTACSLIDIAPTVLLLAHLPPMANIDGKPLLSLMGNGAAGRLPRPAKSAGLAMTLDPQRLAMTVSRTRPFFMESADTIADIETDSISVSKVLKHQIHAYHINQKTALLSLNPAAATNIIKNKQRAILMGDWLLAYYPASKQQIFDKKNHHFDLKTINVPAYAVLINIKSGYWTKDLSSTFAKSAPLATLEQLIKAFYGDEIPKIL